MLGSQKDLAVNVQAYDLFKVSGMLSSRTGSPTSHCFLWHLALQFSSFLFPISLSKKFLLNSGYLTTAFPH